MHPHCKRVFMRPLHPCVFPPPTQFQPLILPPHPTLFHFWTDLDAKGFVTRPHTHPALHSPSPCPPQSLAAQLCYVLAGVPPSFFDVTQAQAQAQTPHYHTQGPRYCLLGVDHTIAPRTYATALTIQRTEVLEWARVAAASSGQSPHASAAAAAAGGQEGGVLPGGLLLPLQPYKLVYAHMLAEYGRIPEALAYCQALEAVLGTGGGGGKGVAGARGLPPSFALMSKGVEELKERLTTYAQV